MRGGNKMAFDWEADLKKLGDRLDRAIEDGDVQKQEDLTAEIRQVEDIIEQVNRSKGGADDGISM